MRIGLQPSPKLFEVSLYFLLDAASYEVGGNNERRYGKDGLDNHLKCVWRVVGHGGSPCGGYLVWCKCVFGDGGIDYRLRLGVFLGSGGCAGLAVLDSFAEAVGGGFGVLQTLFGVLAGPQFLDDALVGFGGDFRKPHQVALDDFGCHAW